MKSVLLGDVIGREVVKAALGMFLRWPEPRDIMPGFSIVLGVPWDLRHLLPVNLLFVSKTDCSELRRVHVVFDKRPRAGAGELIHRVRKEFPALPLMFHFYNSVPGWIVERVHISTYYNSLNTIVGLGACDTKYAILHDFDLYPVVPDHFTSIVRAMRIRKLRFSGHERTHFDGLTDADNQIGTWTLGVDAEWLRRMWRPIDCFQKSTVLNDRRVNLDPYAFIQSRTPERDLADGRGTSSFCHVKNLCSTYLRFLKGGPLKLAWRMHYLWYLESHCGRDRLAEIAGAMRDVRSAGLVVDGREMDFSTTHVTCANVLEDELSRMETALFGRCRDHVRDYIAAFREFLSRHGDTTAIDAEPAGAATAG